MGISADRVGIDQASYQMLIGLTLVLSQQRMQKHPHIPFSLIMSKKPKRHYNALYKKKLTLDLISVIKNNIQKIKTQHLSEYS